MDFYISIYKDNNHLDLQVTETLNEAVSVCNSSVGNHFKIHPDGQDHYLVGDKQDNGHIDWMKNELIGIERLK